MPALGPLWPFVPSTLYAAFLANEIGQASIAVLTWDASLHGWGLLLRWWDRKDGKVIIGSLPDSDDMMHQVRSETLAGVLSLEAAAREVDLHDATVIFRYEAVGALSALRKGSFSSTILQACAMHSCHLQRRVRCNPLYLHAPGSVLVAEGIDAHSRDGALEVTGPTCGPRIRALAHHLALTCSWIITVDAFASQSNCLVPRFFARYAEHAAEAEDAFTVPDWAYSVCPACSLAHRETLFAFPPPPLLNAFVAKARADCARAVVLTPLAVTAPYWNKLLRAPSSLTPRATAGSAAPFGPARPTRPLCRRLRKRHLSPPHQLACHPLRPNYPKTLTINRIMIKTPFNHIPPQRQKML
jgi:hypothetical protein